MSHTHRFRVEWGETDAAAIAFYPNFFKWFDAGTWRLLMSVGITLDVLREDHGILGCPIVEASSQFHRPARFWDEIELTSRVRRWGRRSFIVAHEVRVDGELRASGQETRVMARYVDGQGHGIEAAPIPESLRRLLPVLEP